MRGKRTKKVAAKEAADLKAYRAAQLVRVRKAASAWTVEVNGPESHRTIGYFESFEDALLVYRATRITEWLNNNNTVQLGLGHPADDISKDKHDARGGIYCKVGSMDWVGLKAILIAPPGLGGTGEPEDDL